MISSRVLIYGCIVSAFVIVLATPRVSLITSACPVVMPQPLRSLYQESDLIVVARAGRSRVAQTDSNHHLLRTDLIVSSIHKGQLSDPVIHLYRWASARSPELGVEYKQGNALLLFLVGRKGGDGYEVVDGNYGVKQLPDADLRVYLDRIGELAAIMRQDKPNDEEVVEWLVRCVEDAATRWEGAYELGLSTYALGSEEDQATDDDQEEDGEDEDDDQEEVSEQTEGVDDTEELSETPADTRNQNADPIFVLLLTDGQRERLTTAFLGTSTITEDDFYLLRVVETFHDPRVAEFLLAQLNRWADNPPGEADFVIEALGRITNDRSLALLAREYSRIVSNVDSEEIDEESDGNDQARAVNVRAEMVKLFLSVAKKRVLNR